MAEMQLAALDGHRVAYETGGQGRPALVWVHGWTAGRWQWRRQMEADGWRRRLLALDLPGHGDSDKPATGYTMTFFARAVVAAMDHAGIGRAVLVGHSNGVPVIRQFYRLYPARTEGLVMADGALRPLPPDRLRWFLAAIERPDYEGFIRMLAEQAPRGDLAPEDWQRLKQGQIDTPRHVMRGGLEAMADPSVWSEDPITVPLLVLKARAPGSGPDEDEALIRRLAPQAHYQAWENATHFFPLEQPARFNQTLQTWLAGLPV